MGPADPTRGQLGEQRFSNRLGQPVAALATTMMLLLNLHYTRWSTKHVGEKLCDAGPMQSCCWPEAGAVSHSHSPGDCGLTCVRPGPHCRLEVEYRWPRLTLPANPLGKRVEISIPPLLSRHSGDYSRLVSYGRNSGASWHAKTSARGDMRVEGPRGRQATCKRPIERPKLVHRGDPRKKKRCLSYRLVECCGATKTCPRIYNKSRCYF
jgi:hypothetical protein